MSERGFFHPTHGYWQTNGEVPPHIFASYPDGTIEVALKPGSDYEFDGADWVFVEADAAAALSDLREATYITRRALCMACRDIGLFTNEQAIAAARGEWPALLMAALDGLTDNQKADAQMEWSDVTTVRRMSPLILLLQWHLDYTDAQVDALFGIGGDDNG